MKLAAPSKLEPNILTIALHCNRTRKIKATFSADLLSRSSKNEK